MIDAAKLMTGSAPLPGGMQLLGWIDRHPREDHGPGYAVLRVVRTGLEVAWDGAAIRSLPRDWGDKVRFERRIS